MNYIKLSYIIFLSKCLDIPIKYLLQDWSTNFWIGGIRKLWDQKTHTRIFELYQIFIHIFLSKWLNIFIRRFNVFWIVGTRTLWVQKSHTRIFELYQGLKCSDILELYIAYKKNYAPSYYKLLMCTKSITL